MDTAPPIPVTIRPARPEDHPRCAEIFVAAQHAAFSWQRVRPVAADYYASIEGEEVWVAERDGLLVGLCSIYRPENFVHSLYLDPSWRGRGIGGLLLTRALTRIGRPARLKTDVENKAAQRFYERLGWWAESTGVGEQGAFILYRTDR